MSIKCIPTCNLWWGRPTRLLSLLYAVITAISDIEKVLSKESTMKLFSLVKFRLKKFFDESSIHGLKYITENNRHWTERIFWALVNAIAAFTLLTYSKKVLMQSARSPVSFVLETSYLRWNTEFPAVSVCETDADLGNIETTAEKLFGKDRNPEIDVYLREIAFFDGKCFSCKETCGESLDCPRNLSQLAFNARVSCKELLSDCAWNGEKFDCCENFPPLQTETGLCFTINSLQTDQASNIRMISNASTGPGELEFSANRETYVFIHPKEDLPFLNTPEELRELVMLSSHLTIHFQVTEIENDLSLKNVDVPGRKCRFPNEGNVSHHNLYSYSACVTECRLAAHANLCNCTHHFMKSSGLVPVCSLEQLSCLFDYFDTLKKLKPLRSDSNYDHSLESGLACPCESSCTEPDLEVVSKQSRFHSEASQSRVTIKLENLPSIRFKRYITKTRIDMFVTVGGLFGLYLGASVLSLVEILYFLLIRKNVLSPNRSQNCLHRPFIH